MRTHIKIFAHKEVEWKIGLEATLFKGGADFELSKNNDLIG